MQTQPIVWRLILTAVALTAVGVAVPAHADGYDPTGPAAGGRLTTVVNGHPVHFLPSRPYLQQQGHGVSDSVPPTGTGSLPYDHHGQIQQYTIPVLIYWYDSSSGLTFPPRGSQPIGYGGDTAMWWVGLYRSAQAGIYAGTPLSLLREFTGIDAQDTSAITYSGYVYTPTIILDDHPFPASDCSQSSVSYCIVKSDIDSEVQRLMTAYQIAPSLYPSINYDLVVYLPPGLGTCFDTTSTSCSWSQFCAYHSSVLQGASVPIEIVQPYPIDGNGATAACANQDTGAYPNGNVAADAANNLVWHEYAESVTDPRFDGWRSDDGNEVADYYAWVFPAPLGRTSNGTYNAWWWTGLNGPGIGSAVVSTLQCIMRPNDGSCALTG